MAIFKVSKTGANGKRIKTNKIFRKRSIAEEFARKTNRFSPGARARVISLKKKKK